MRRVCEYCKTECEIPDALLKRCKMQASDLKGFKPHKGKGCVKCNSTGYYGRLGAIEVLMVSPRIREMVMQRKSSDEIQKIGVEEGMETLYQNALNLFKKGMTTLEEVLRVSSPE